MEEDTNALFKEKFKMNPIAEDLSILQMLKTALHKKHSRDLFRKLQEKHSWVLKEKRVLLDKQQLANIDVKMIEQIIVHSKGSTCISKKNLKIIKMFLKTQPLPDTLRKDVWMLASGARIKMNQNPEYYHKLQKLLEDYPDCFLRAIELDLKRTFPEKPYDPNDPEIVKMRRILSAFAKRNPTVGYCQGFNFIMSKMVTVVEDEEEAFWLFTTLIEDILPTDYFTWMIGVLVDLEILTEIVNLFCPNLEAKFEELSVHPGQLYSLQWLICIFTSAYPDNILRVIWDFLFVDGTRIMFKAGLHLYEKFQQEIIEVEEFHEVLAIFEEASKQSWNPTEFFTFIGDVYISNKMLRFLRERVKAKVKKDIEQIEKSNHTRQETSASKIAKQEDSILCNMKWPICIEAIENAKREKRASSFFVFRATQLPLTIDHNYFKCEVTRDPTDSKRFTIDRAQNLPRRISQQSGTQEGIALQETDKANQSKINVELQNGMVIGRFTHICAKKKEPLTNAADVMTKVQSEFSNLSGQNVTMEDTQDPHSAAFVYDKRKTPVVTRPKSNSLFGYLGGGFGFNKKPLSAKKNQNNNLSPRLQGELETITSENDSKAVIISYGSSNEDEEEKDDYTYLSPEMKLSSKASNYKKDQNGEGSMHSNTSSIIQEEKSNSQPRLSIISYLLERDKASSNFSSDFMSKSTRFLNEFLDRNRSALH